MEDSSLCFNKHLPPPKTLTPGIQRPQLETLCITAHCSENSPTQRPSLIRNSQPLEALETPCRQALGPTPQQGGRAPARLAHSCHDCLQSREAGDGRGDNLTLIGLPLGLSIQNDAYPSLWGNQTRSCSRSGRWQGRGKSLGPSDTTA